MTSKRVFLSNIFLFVSIFAFVSVFFPRVISAQTPTPMPDTQMVDSAFLWQVNPLTVQGNSNGWVAHLVGRINVGKFSTPAGFLNALIPYLFSLAGIILFIMIVWGGFEMILGAADTKSFDKGKSRVSSALIGFTLLFCSYWIAQIIQYIFGVNILGNV